MLKAIFFAIPVLFGAGAGVLAFQAMHEAGSGAAAIKSLEYKLTSLEDSNDELKRTLEDLRGELTRSQQRLVSVEGSVSDARETMGNQRRRRGDREGRPEFSEGMEEGHEDEMLAAVKTKLGDGAVAEDAVLREVVRGAMEDLRAEEEQQRTERRMERSKERTKERVAEMAERLQLQPYQQEELTSILIGRTQERWDLFAQARNGEMDRQDIRAKMEESREASDAEIQRVLTTDQYAEYKVIEEESGGERGWWGGRRRGNNNGNNNNNNNSSDSGSTNAGGDTGSGNNNRRRP